MKKPKLIQYGVTILWLILGAGAGLLVAGLQREPPQERALVIRARKYAFSPHVLRVNRGDRIEIRLEAEDVTHGFYLEGYDIDAKVRPENPTFWLRRPSEGEEEYEEVEAIRFTADRTGKFRYRCSITCGYMHPFMQGELIVEPNYLYPVSLGLTGGLVLALLLPLGRRRGS